MDGWGYPMTRRFSVAVAILALAAIAFLPGVAGAQLGSPPAVAGNVIEQAPQVSGDTLPRTGGDVISMAIGAVALLVVGGMLVVATRRRRADGPSLA